MDPTVSIYRGEYRGRLSDNEWDEAISVFPIAEQEYVNSFRKDDDRHCRLIARQLLERALVEHGFEPVLMSELKKGPNGKPLLDEAHFNISHSGELVLLAFSLDVPVGIDIEKIRPIEHQKFVKQFHEEELRDFEEAKISEERFFEYWTRKEAVIKAIGKGLKKPLIDFQVRDLGHIDLDEDGQWFLTEISTSTKYKACLCSPGAVRVVSKK
jgi:4'-phosphopantetheinyl transferase